MFDKVCFLLAPIGSERSEIRDRSNKMLEYLIKPAVEQAGYKVLRADNIAAPGLITSQIIQHVIKSQLAIADLSGMNPNVMYELAIRHAVGKPVIQITSDPSRIPFDVAGMRTIVIDINNLESIERAKHSLKEMIESIDKEGIDFDSPVSVAINLGALERTIKKEKSKSKKISEVDFTNTLKDIQSTLKSLEYKIEKKFTSTDSKESYSRRIFIVHGHDGELKNELARFLEKLDFEPIILHEQPDRGQTIFAKLNNEMADVGYSFVLLTPDDIGSKKDRPDEMKNRARQNVIFEQGLFTGYLKYKRVCAIRKGDVEIPSDLHGIVYKTVPSDGSIRSIAIDIVNELRAAGYLVDPNKLFSI